MGDALKNSLQWIANGGIWLILVILAAFIANLVRLYIHRPKLKQVGGGSGQYHHICIQNMPGLFGIDIGPTMIAGKQLVPGIKKGLPYDRNAARKCSAVVRDKATGQVVGYPVWEQNGQFDQSIDLNSGESANLVLFSRHGVTGNGYYLWKPGLNGAAPTGPAQGTTILSGGRSFTIVVDYGHGTVKRDFRFHVIERLDGTFAYKHDTGGGRPF